MTQQPKGHRWFAAAYDRMSRSGERRLFGPLRAELLASLDGRVLELGIGTGVNLPHYAPDIRVTGIEPDPYMLRRAQLEAAAIGRDDVELHQARAEWLPYREHTFDHVVCTLVLCTIPDVPAALAEVRRVLKPGGVLHAIEHVRAEGWLGKVQDIIRPVWSYCGAGCNPNRRTAQALEAAGFRFERLETRRYRFGMLLISGSAMRA
jgi:ubiquinone/menaquinone biosynthesis C-methylase UbiE